MLDRMRRGYTREAYLQLVGRARATIPDVALSSDFIAGFCGETEEEHADTLSLLEAVKFEMVRGGVGGGGRCSVPNSP